VAQPEPSEVVHARHWLAFGDTRHFFWGRGTAVSQTNPWTANTRKLSAQTSEEIEPFESDSPTLPIHFMCLLFSAAVPLRHFPVHALLSCRTMSLLLMLSNLEVLEPSCTMASFRFKSSACLSKMVALLVHVILSFGDLVVWLVCIVGPVKWVKQVYKGLESHPCDAAGTRRKSGMVELTTSPHRDCATMHELMQKSTLENGPLKALGSRTFLGLYPVEQPGWPKKVFGATKWKTYSQLRDEAAAFGRGLRALGMQPLSAECSTACTENFEQIFGPHALLIFEDTCADWMIGAIGAMSQSMPVTTSYATLGMHAVAEILNDCAAPTILVNYKHAGACAALANGACPTLKVVIYTRLDTEEDAPSLSETSGTGDNKVTVTRFVEIQKSFEEHLFAFCSECASTVFGIMTIV